MPSIAEEVARATQLLLDKARTEAKSLVTQVFNVKGYGAWGDGVHDDTEAVQTAIDDCAKAGGGVVVFPPGTFLIKGVLIKSHRVNLAGAGVGATIIKLAPNSVGACIQVADYVTGQTPTVEDLSISDLEIDGNKANQNGDGEHIGIRVEDVERIRIERVKVHNCDGYGIGLVGTDLPHRADFVVKDAELHHNAYDGIDIKGGAARITLSNIRSHHNGGGTVPGRAAHGIDVRGEFITVESCFAWSNDGHGISTRELGYAKRTVITGCHAFDNITDGFIIDGDEVVVVGCVAKGNRYGYNVGAANKRVTLIGCVAYSNMQVGFLCNNVTGGLSLIGCTADSNGTGIADGRGIQIANMASPWLIEGCTIIDQDSPGTQPYAIHFSGSNVGGRIANNILSAPTGIFRSPVPAGTTMSGNIGYVTENAGDGTIADGQNSVVISHGLAGAPSAIIITPRTNADLWVSNRTATTFTVSRSGTSGDVAFFWQAVMRW